MPLDPGDIEQGRVPLRARDHAQIIQDLTDPRLRDPSAVETAEIGVDERRRALAAESREVIQDKIAANEAKGLHRTAPPIEEEAAESPSQAVPSIEIERGPQAPQGLMDADAQSGDEAAAIESLKRTGLRKTRDVAEHLERGALAKLPKLRSAGRSLKTLEEAADVLIAELEPNHIDAILQVCQEHGLPNWVVILGAIARMADLQELNAGEFRDEWVNRPSSRVGTSAAPKIEVCQLCGQVIPGARKGQVACCNAHGSGKVEHTAGCPLVHVQMVKGAWVTVAVP